MNRMNYSFIICNIHHIFNIWFSQKGYSYRISNFFEKHCEIPSIFTLKECKNTLLFSHFASENLDDFIINLKIYHVTDNIFKADYYDIIFTFSADFDSIFNSIEYYIYHIAILEEYEQYLNRRLEKANAILEDMYYAAGIDLPINLEGIELSDLIK